MASLSQHLCCSLKKCNRTVNYIQLQCRTAINFHTISTRCKPILTLKHCTQRRLDSSLLSTLSSESDGSGQVWPPLGRLLKTHSCNCLRPADVGSRVVLRGFVAFLRKRKFVLIRDTHGITQILLPEEGKLLDTVDSLTYESYIEVEGTVRRRPEGQENMTLATGEVEVEVAHLKVLSAAPAMMPFLIRPHNMPTESLGLKYRYLQLRYPHLQRNLRLRSQVSKRMSDFLQDVEGFVNVNTPTLAAHTSGGAHLFVVPYAGSSETATKESGTSAEQSSSDPSHAKGEQSNSSTGCSVRDYYCLAQSPQTYKQLLMASGLDKYYQFAVCYRDEVGRPDRQPEFMQVDLEACDVTVGEVRALVERLLRYSWPDSGSGPPPTTPFPSITYRHAMDRYGSDKPDTRFGWQLRDVTSLVLLGCTAEHFTETLEGDQRDLCSARVLVVPGGQKYISRKVHQSWERIATREHGLPGVALLTVQGEGRALQGALGKKFTDMGAADLLQRLDAKPGDSILLSVGRTDNALSLLGRVRLLAATLLEEAGVAVRDKTDLSFLWVVDFPLFERAPGGLQLQSVHHPFTRPHPDDMHLLDTDPLKVRSQHFDLVCAGCEVGGGSERVHEPTLQRRLLELLQLPPHEMEYFLEALKLGVPPHTGIALGFDRLVSLLCGADSIRDVVAFPKNNQGRCTMSGSPSDISVETKKRHGL